MEAKKAVSTRHTERITVKWTLDELIALARERLGDKLNGFELERADVDESLPLSEDLSLTFRLETNTGSVEPLS
jgi:hypothetical protein